MWGFVVGVFIGAWGTWMVLAGDRQRVITSATQEINRQLQTQQAMRAAFTKTHGEALGALYEVTHGKPVPAGHTVVWTRDEERKLVVIAEPVPGASPSPASLEKKGGKK